LRLEITLTAALPRDGEEREICAAQRSVTRGRSSNDRCVAVAGKEQTARMQGDRRSCRLLRNSSASLSRSTQRRQTYSHV